MNYIAKGRDSFTTKLNLFIYKVATASSDELTLENFKKFSMTKDLVDEYTTVYWQELKTYKIGELTISEIERRIEKLKKEHEKFIKELERYYLKEVFPVIFPKDAFDTLLKAEKCSYCGLTERQVVQMANDRKIRKKNFRGWRLEIDRLDSNFEYTPENCVMCCYWCNNAKTDEFTPEEFKPIGEAIATVWSNRQRRIERFGSDGSEIRLVKRS